MLPEQKENIARRQMRERKREAYVAKREAYISADMAAFDAARAAFQEAARWYAFEPENRDAATALDVAALTFATMTGRTVR